ncbi:SUMF1/EgtB/PvdO family nonheme iron enzyme [Microcystis flos-aquae FACHB-1344]|uniref:SUMF1/EgtB/PvdO family nonheme iron enzyme n=1 Tax=Microcystis flos-aquae FACHB-1344 TaxID=2692899 RepID=A0ABR8HXU9_9CHRO|nr:MULTISPECIES: SUMF1/EgtB/PvdO family nonheme iron enzyme [Microcystis]MBD2624348.1 SUMF1/EgtB/PvdO family nonheme iron enzyme [Microcystis flos-aquae FACHB-1344]MCA2700998.1 SUMF1/EgtB/PvdO family nonheme iron enzyme [Microcystis sp. M179S2]
MLDQMMKMLEGQQIGPYRLNKFLGAGGFGGVFHASEMVRNTSVKEVAIKVIPESSDDKLIELTNSRKLEHPNLIKSYAVGEFTFLNTEMLYLVMELAQGSLENHIAKASLSADEITNITAQVAQGLNYLHRQNKVHRDLKPGNILKVNQQYKLADFGLIRTLNNKSHTQTVHNTGTIIYMPPEAFRGDISSAWDLWSLGIMLIQMTTNQFPYKFNNDNNQLMVKVINCELQIPSLPKEFKPIIEGCLQKDRKQRWTAQQVLNALQAVKKPVSPIPLIVSPTPFTENLPNRVTLEMVSLPAGEFLMGSPDSDPDARDWEKPPHQVKVNSFAIGKYLVTQAQYEAVMGTNPSYFSNNSWFKNNLQNPVEKVSWDDAQAFCQKLSQITGKTYRLPTEAEWEYACRAGTTTRYYFGDDANQLGDYAWYDGNSQKTTHPVGQKRPNAWGLYDMSGNVFEWCEDDWHDNYIGAPKDGSAWTINNDNRSHPKCLRGGSWVISPNICRSANRVRDDPGYDYGIDGFRVACVSPGL